MRNNQDWKKILDKGVNKDNSFNIYVPKIKSCKTEVVKNLSVDGLDGMPHPFEVINKPEASVIAIFNPEYTKMFLIKEFRIGIKDEKGNFGGYEYGSAGGIFDKVNENAIQVALRELSEETGFDLDKVSNVKKHGSYYPTCGCSSEIVNLFSCTIPENSERSFKSTNEGEDIVDWGWYSLDEAQSLIVSMSSTIIIKDILLNKIKEGFLMYQAQTELCCWNCGMPIWRGREFDLMGEEHNVFCKDCCEEEEE